MIWLWKWFLARFRLNDAVICEMSRDKGPYNDFHDYPDDPLGLPIHMILLKCKRCGKEFYI